MPEILIEEIRTLCDNGHDMHAWGDGLYRCMNCRFELRSIECLKP